MSHQSNLDKVCAKAIEAAAIEHVSFLKTVAAVNVKATKEDKEAEYKFVNDHIDKIEAIWSSLSEDAKRNFWSHSLHASRMQFNARYVEEAVKLMEEK